MRKGILEICEVGSGMKRKDGSCVVKQEEKDPEDESKALTGTTPIGFYSDSQDLVFQQTGGCG